MGETIILQSDEKLTDEQIAKAAASDSITDVIKQGTPSAADLDADAAEQAAAAEPDTALDAEAEFESVYVTRAEFNALVARIDKYNIGAPHKL